MSQLFWRRYPAAGPATVVLLHGWAGDSSLWERAGVTAALERAGIAALAADLPGHAGSAELGIPGTRDPAAWASQAVAADLHGFGVRSCAVVGFAEGGMVAAHLAVGDDVPVTRLGLLASDDRNRPPQAEEAASALRDPRARLWTPEASDLVARVRAGRSHDPAVLATWLERARWPAAARLGAVPMPVLVATGGDDPLRDRAPQLAALFRDGHLVTAPGSGEGALASAELHEALVAFLTAEEA